MRRKPADVPWRTWLCLPLFQLAWLVAGKRYPCRGHGYCFGCGVDVDRMERSLSQERDWQRDGRLAAEERLRDLGERNMPWRRIHRAARPLRESSE